MEKTQLTISDPHKALTLDGPATNENGELDTYMGQKESPIEAVKIVRRRTKESIHNADLQVLVIR